MRWKAFFAGDICLQKSVPGGFLEPGLARLIGEHDVRSCNFEGSLRPAGAKPISKIGPAVALIDEAADACRAAGFNVFNLANNHIYDFGEPGLRATLEAFQGSLAVGAGATWDDAYGLRTMQVGALTLGFLSFAEAQPGALTEREPKRGGFAWIGHPDAAALVAQSRKMVDVLFVQCHAGVEGISIPLPEWRQVYRNFIDSGADAVIGHHPHIPQGWEFYKEKPIVYSLGNFFFPRHPNGWGMAISMSFEGPHLRGLQALPIVERDNQSVIAPERQAELNQVCDSLAEGVYEKQVEFEALRLWRERYATHYRIACDGIAFLTLGKDLARFLFRPQHQKHVHLLHNLQIESHRWTTERALRLMTRESA